MPSILVVYSPNLEGEFDVDELTLALNQKAQSLGVFPEWGVRVLAVKAQAGVAGDGDASHGYVQVTVRIAPGRPREVQAVVTQELFSVLDDRLDGLKARKLGYAVDLVEFDPLTYRSGGNLPGSPTA